jgi:hypothetical protein
MVTASDSGNSPGSGNSPHNYGLGPKSQDRFFLKSSLPAAKIAYAAKNTPSVHEKPAGPNASMPTPTACGPASMPIA